MYYCYAVTYDFLIHLFIYRLSSTIPGSGKIVIILRVNFYVKLFYLVLIKLLKGETYKV